MARLTESNHGGNVYAAARSLRRPIERLIDFSASINPLGPSPRALHALVRARRLLRHYPDPDCVALREALAARWRCRSEQIVIGNGSTELIHLLPVALEIGRLMVVGPTFSEYARAMERSGGSARVVAADRADGYKPPLEAVIRGIHARRPAVDAILLCNPNSPTGQACDVDEVVTLARVAERRGVRLIVDETFIDYCEDRSILPWIDQHKNVIVLRSFTKFFALPGLRAGYLVAQAETAQAIHSAQPPWSVNVLAQEAALAALKDAPHAERSRSFMRRERARFAAQLGALPGCRLFPSEANFLLMELPSDRQAGTVAARLRREGILVRDCSTVPGLNQRSMRLAVRTRRENDRLRRALSRELD